MANLILENEDFGNEDYLDALKESHLTEIVDPVDILLFIKRGMQSDTFWDRATTGGKVTLVVGAGVLAGLIITSGVKVYKNYLSKIGRQCKQAKNKDECMQKAREKAQQYRISGGTLWL